mgnify:CR=1 FL=1
MRKYTIVIEDTAEKEFEVYADDSEEAMKIAEKKYKNGEFILDPGEVQFKQMCISRPENEVTEWSEF